MIHASSVTGTDVSTNVYTHGTPTKTTLTTVLTSSVVASNNTKGTTPRTVTTIQISRGTRTDDRPNKKYSTVKISSTFATMSNTTVETRRGNDTTNVSTVPPTKLLRTSTSYTVTSKQASKPGRL